MELAEHFAQSSDPEDLGKAIQYGEVAAQRAMGVYAYGEAARLLETALQAQEVLDPADRATRVGLLLALGDALLPGASARRAVDEVLEEAFQLAEAAGAREQVLRACRSALTGLSRIGSATAPALHGYRTWVERADRYAEPGTALRAYADIALGRTATDHAASRALRVGAFEAARESGDREALFEAAFNMVDVRVPEQESERWALAQELADQPRDGISARSLARVLCYLGGAYYTWGHPERAAELRRELAALQERAGDPALLRYRTRAEVPVLAAAGRLEEAVALADNLVTESTATGVAGPARLYRHTVIVYPLLHLGRARQLLEEPDPRTTEDILGQQAVTARRIVALSHAGRVDDGLAGLKAEMRTVTTGAGAARPADQLAMLLDAAVLVGDAEAAAFLASRLEPVAFQAAAGDDPVCMARLLGGAAALAGEPARARDYYLQALQVAAQVHNRPETALTRLQLAELLLDRYPDERTDALAHLDFAILEFGEMKMQPALERALKHKGLLHA